MYVHELKRKLQLQYQILIQTDRCQVIYYFTEW